MKPLGRLPGGVWDTGVAEGVSEDGSIVVGHLVDASDFEEAFRWSNGTLVGLGHLEGQPNSGATAVSGNGQRVVGWSGDDPEGADVELFLWEDAAGMRPLGAILAERGFEDDLSHARQLFPRAISADGNTIVGYAYVFVDEDWQLTGFRLSLVW